MTRAELDSNFSRNAFWETVSASSFNYETSVHAVNFDGVLNFVTALEMPPVKFSSAYMKND